ncbi:hypothetical protein [Corynebacterium aquilae]|uniref:Uncharacterized protein n=1 Tax=Corynebacterium aquilae DSM 44791 TaxID=1431546 RepID=A0A1L7CEU7_9CORY|nr:hypothetical protein [Corynebacterium aquilae]APT84400.1 hypothetical protein CAQU_04175 [Corynebacterium aquilae DSM 44791]
MSTIYRRLLPNGSMFVLELNETTARDVQAIGLMYWEFYFGVSPQSQVGWFVEDPNLIVLGPWGSEVHEIAAVGVTARFESGETCASCGRRLVLATREDLELLLKGETVSCRHCRDGFEEQVNQVSAHIDELALRRACQRSELERYVEELKKANHPEELESFAARQALLRWDIARAYEDTIDEYARQLPPGNRLWLFELLTTQDVALMPSAITQSRHQAPATVLHDISDDAFVTCARLGALVYYPSDNPEDYVWHDEHPTRATLTHPPVRLSKLRGPCDEDQHNAALLRFALGDCFNPMSDDPLPEEEYLKVFRRALDAECLKFISASMKSVGLPPLSPGHVMRLNVVLKMSDVSLTPQSIVDFAFALCHGRADTHDMHRFTPAMIGTTGDSTIVAPHSVDEFIELFTATIDSIDSFTGSKNMVNRAHFPQVTTLLVAVLGLTPERTTVADVEKRLSTIEDLIFEGTPRAYKRLTYLLHEAEAPTLKEQFGRIIAPLLVSEKIRLRRDRSASEQDFSGPITEQEMTQVLLDEPISLEQARSLYLAPGSTVPAGIPDILLEEVNEFLSDDDFKLPM